MSNFLEAIEQVSSQDLFFYSEPEVLDFTSNKPVALVICSKDLEIKVPLATDDTKLKETLGLLQLYLGNEKSIILTWKIKNFLTYAKAKTGIDFSLKGNVLDLSILENYQAIDQTRPENFITASVRVKQLMSLDTWSNIYKIYNSIYKPLITTLPKIEALGFVNKKNKKKIFCYYEIDGQINGRMKCSNVFNSSFNPHTLSAEDKENINPNGFHKSFVSFDFRHMEVSMLQWLAKDDYLYDLTHSDKDTYESLWESITSIPSNANNRQKCKEFFLPIVYGLGATSLSENLKIPLDFAKKLIDRVYKTIPISMGWIKKQQESLVDNKAKDYFGRVRHFDSSYKVRNFSVQSPASLVCVHKLTKLSTALDGIADIGMHIHDGYIIVCNRYDITKVVNIAKPILESDDELYSGLKLKALCKVGENLNDLVIYER